VCAFQCEALLREEQRITLLATEPYITKAYNNSAKPRPVAYRIENQIYISVSLNLVEIVSNTNIKLVYSNSGSDEDENLTLAANKQKIFFHREVHSLSPDRSTLFAL
jgi:hypothetical protein